MSTFYNDFIERSPYFNSLARINDINLLEPATRDAVIQIMRDAEQGGQILTVWETYRSRERQQYLFQKGVTQLPDVGVHHYGLAADLVRMVNDQPTWQGDYGFLRDLAGKYGLVSGLDWGQTGHNPFVDACHVQRITVEDQQRLFAGAWYPDADYKVA